MGRRLGGLCRGARGSYIFLMSAPTNRKAATPKESPQEPFKRAVAGTMRAMAKTPKLDVSFAPERPSLIVGEDGAKARLARTGAQNHAKRGGDHARMRGFARASSRLSQ